MACLCYNKIALKYIKLTGDKMLYAKDITLRVNSDQYNQFNKTCEYLHNIKRQNCYYDKSAPFSYIIKFFNREFNNHSKSYWINQIKSYNSKVKKDFQLNFSLKDYEYNQFNENCTKLGIKRSVVIRSLMQRLIEETQIE